MTIREGIGDLVDSMTGLQKLVLGGVAAVVLMVMVSGWVSSFWSGIKVRQAERQAAAALKKAAEIAVEIAKREKEIEKIEVKRDEKQKELDAADADADRDRTELERARREQRTDAPTAAELCRELADLGYPCIP